MRKLNNIRETFFQNIIFFRSPCFPVKSFLYFWYQVYCGIICQVCTYASMHVQYIIQETRKRSLLDFFFVKVLIFNLLQLCLLSFIREKLKLWELSLLLLLLCLLQCYRTLLIPVLQWRHALTCSHLNAFQEAFD